MKTIKVRKDGVEIPIPSNLRRQFLRKGWTQKVEVDPKVRRKRYEQELQEKERLRSANIQEG